MICCVRAGGRSKHNFLIGGAFRKAKYEIRWRRKKSESESEGGQKFLPSNPLPFCPPECSVSAARSAAISQSFVQKRFELRSVIATNQDISNFQGKEFARSPRLRRISLRKKPCISELNRKDGQIKIQFFGKANGGSELRSNSQMKIVSNFSVFYQMQKYKASF